MTRILLTSLALASAALAQDVVSARAGMIQFIEGAVEMDGKAVEMPAREKMFSQVPEVRKGSLLSTAEGRAEILLSPGITLRLGENATMKMVESDLSDTKVEIQKGAAVVEVLELLKGNLATIFVDKAFITFSKPGTYNIHADGAPELLVYDGQAEVTVAGVTKTVKRGTNAALNETLAMRKFDTEKGDALLRWSMRRSGYMAMANVSAASAARANGYTGRMGGWMWNPYYGMFTYLPFNGMMCSAYIGSCYYSPAYVYRAFYAPRYPGGGGGGVNGGGMDAASMGGHPASYSYDANRGYTVATGDRSYGGLSASPSVGGGGGAPAASAPAADSGGGRSGGDSGGRGGEGGGRQQ